jgi:hypothetical protein
MADLVRVLGLIASCRRRKHTQQALALLEGEQTVDLLFTDLGLHDDLEAGLTAAQKAVKRIRPTRALYHGPGDNHRYESNVCGAKRLYCQTLHPQRTQRRDRQTIAGT